MLESHVCQRLDSNPYFLFLGFHQESDWKSFEVYLPPYEEPPLNQDQAPISASFPVPFKPRATSKQKKKTGRKIFKCVTCDRTYNHRGSLSKHLIHECGKTPQQSCKLCPYATKLRENLRRHVKKKHPFVQCNWEELWFN